VGGGSGVAVGRRRVVVGGRVIVAGPLYMVFSAIASWITTQSQLHPTYD
jgi:hypothetical protein